jgi:CBS domain containing-hemolysin-like protein
MNLPLAALFFLLICILALVSYVEGLYHEMGKFLSREFQENIEALEQQVEPRLRISRARASLSMSLWAQLATAGLAAVLAYDVFDDGQWTTPEIIQAAVVLMLAIVLFNRVLPFVLFTRTRGEWLREFVWPLRLLIYLALPITLVLNFSVSVAALTKEHTSPQPENSAEAVDAFIEAGQEEGLLQEGDRELIQSVMEFGEKTVREVMTPRPEIVAVPVNTTVEQFTELLKEKPFSRLPVYEHDIDHVRGIVFAHDVLQISDAEARSRRVTEMMRPAYYVPETQRVTTLLRQMQRDNVHMAIVIDEYGSVAGVVTIEDLVEEIVGEIRDEHEPASDVVREGEHSYVVPGSMDIDRLAELFGVRPGDVEATTVGGLVSEIMGRIPAAGEAVEHEGLRFEVVEATNYRIERLRISSVMPRQQPLRA